MLERSLARKANSSAQDSECPLNAQKKRKKLTSVTHCASHGHGMARTTLCSQGIAALMAGKTYSESGLPECFAPTYARFKQSDKSVYMMWLERFGETAGPEAEEAAAAKL